MEIEKKEYCAQCFLSFGLAEPRRHRIVGNPEGGLEEKSYHISCFHRMELQEMIVEAIKKDKKIVLTS